MIKSHICFIPYIIFFIDTVLIVELRHNYSYGHLLFYNENNAKCQNQSTVDFAL